MAKEPIDRPSVLGEVSPVIAPGQTYETVGASVADVVLSGHVPKQWYIAMAVGFMGVGCLMMSITWLLLRGVGVWGLNVPVAWGFAIINFVWWIGIGHAGTLISAILFLFKQQWRTAINRFAEAMTLFAVACAGMFPLLHLGRPWVFYWLMPYPNTMGLWPQFRSPLIWDVFAVTTYLIISLVFWFTGLIPDLATMRDRAKTKVARTVFGIFALGWRGSARHWHRYEIAYLLLAGLSTPLVISVHSVVSLDFAISLVPGWHTTIFPPYFVAGAIYAGFAMVLTFMIPVRKWYQLEHIITDRHIDNMAKIMLATGLIVVYGYLSEAFFGYYSGALYEDAVMKNRYFGPYAFQYWLLITCNGIIPQLLWLRRIRMNAVILWLITLVVGVGMWLERFIIVVQSLHRDYMPSSWDMYAGTKWDWMLYIGTIGFFLFAMCLFMRWVPMISIFEIREIVHKKSQEDDN